MKSILETCVPRRDLIEGTLNLEVFTASLSQVMNFYRGQAATLHNIYTDADAFFTQATYPTQGLRETLELVFRRLSGDGTVPAIQRLETAFGGGKTHALISLAHLGFQGQELQSLVEGIVDPGLLPEKGSVAVVGIAGDEVAIHRSQGTRLMPYTLWGEIAFQIGGEELYRQVEEAATSPGSPGNDFFDAVLGGRRVLILLDELAQYATRLEAARPNGGDSLATFMMSLHTYARTHEGLAVVLTLAGQADAFARQTERLLKVVGDASGREVDETEAAGIAQKAEKEIRSVVARDATTVVPVLAHEISRVLAQRLFERIDTAAAGETAREYVEMYQRHSGALPDFVSRADYAQILVNFYPFHERFIAFLNNKLAQVENFHGTRGVLRVLALTVRNLWKKQVPAPMIHTCHLDLHDTQLLSEVIGRTGAGDLLPVLNADIGSVDTHTLEGGRSNAQLADERNPHPAGLPMHEYAWKVVFLHSLVGRGEGLGSNLYGIIEPDALAEVSFPGLTPPQVQTGLQAIKEHAFYLRFHEGRYYAHADPTINRALASIRRSLSGDDVDEVLARRARGVVQQGDQGTFWVEHDIYTPENIPDKKNKPVLGVVALDAEPLDVWACVTTAGPNEPRTQQNCVFLLVPRTVLVEDELRNSDDLFHNRKSEAEEALRSLDHIAREVLARTRLRRNPTRYGIPAERVNDPDFARETSERDQALNTAVNQVYDSLWFPSAEGHIIRREIKTGGGEGGAPVLHLIKETLRQQGEIVTAEHATTTEALANLKRLFFEGGEPVSVAQLRDHFLEKRSWPILEDSSLLDQALRAGVARGAWCLFRMGAAESTRPEQLFGRDSGEVPFDVDLGDPAWELVSLEGAKQRGWTGPEKIDPARVEEWVRTAAAGEGATSVGSVVERVRKEHGDVPENDILEAVQNQIRSARLMAFSGQSGQQERPEDLVHGTGAMFYTVTPEHVLVTPGEASRRGWVQDQDHRFTLSGTAGAEKLMPLLRDLGALYGRGARSTLDSLDLLYLELPAGGHLRLVLTGASPDSMRQLEELFEVLASVVRPGENTEVNLTVNDPEEGCALIEQLKEEE